MLLLLPAILQRNATNLFGLTTLVVTIDGHPTFIHTEEHKRLHAVNIGCIYNEGLCSTVSCHYEDVQSRNCIQSIATLHSCGTFAKCISVKARVSLCVSVSIWVRSKGTVYSSPLTRISVVTGWMMQAVPHPNISSRRPSFAAYSRHQRLRRRSPLRLP